MQTPAPSDDQTVKNMSRDWLEAVAPRNYTYNFKWLGRPIIQLPQDIIAVQEILWEVKPKFVVETGVAHGGSLILSASILELLGGEGRVIGIDIDIRAHNREAIEAHPLSKRIDLIQGSAIDEEVVQQVRDRVTDGPVVVILDSNHTHEHVLRELELYSPLVTKDSYLIVMDTAVEDLPKALYPNRPWGPGDNPKTAVWEFLKTNSRFVINKEIDNKLLISVAPDGYLKCIAD